MKNIVGGGKKAADRREAMRVGLMLSGNLLNGDGAKFTAQTGATDIVVHLTNYSKNAHRTPYLNPGVGPIGGDCRGDPLRTHDDFSRVIPTLGRHGPKRAALENFSPNLWGDILLDDPKKRERIDGLNAWQNQRTRGGVALGGNYRYHYGR